MVSDSLSTLAFDNNAIGHLQLPLTSCCSNMNQGCMIKVSCVWWLPKWHKGLAMCFSDLHSPNNTHAIVSGLLFRLFNHLSTSLAGSTVHLYLHQQSPYCHFQARGTPGVLEQLQEHGILINITATGIQPLSSKISPSPLCLPFSLSSSIQTPRPQTNYNLVWWKLNLFSNMYQK